VVGGADVCTRGNVGCDGEAVWTRSHEFEVRKDGVSACARRSLCEWPGCGVVACRSSPDE